MTACRFFPVLGAIAVAWHGVLAEAWTRWLPAWGEPGASFARRLVGGEGSYHHGPLVIVVSGVLAWRAWGRLGHAPREATATLFGVSCLAAGLLGLLASRVLGVTFLGAAALLPALWGLAAVSGGWRGARATAGAVALLVFMVPLPLVLVADLHYTLKHLAAWGGVGLVHAASGLGLTQDAGLTLDGSIVSWSRGPSAGDATMTIGAACSGLRGVITLLWLAGVLAARPGATWAGRAVLLISATPAAVALNAARVAALVAGGRAWGVDAVGPETAFHQLAGLLTLGAGLAVLCAIDRVLDRRTHAAPHPARPPSALPQTTASPAAPPRWLLAALLLLALPLGTLRAATAPHATTGFEAVPRALRLDGRWFVGVDLATPASLGPRLHDAELLHRRYVTADGDRVFDLVLVRHGGDRRALHPPEVCLRGTGLELIDRRQQGLDGSGPRIALTGVGDGGRAAIRYAYHDGARFTTGLWRHQASMAWSLLRGEPRPGAVVRLIVPGLDADPLADAAAATLWPAIDGALSAP